jgi:hypothetical protein
MSTGPDVIIVPRRLMVKMIETMVCAAVSPQWRPLRSRQRRSAIERIVRPLLAEGNPEDQILLPFDVVYSLNEFCCHCGEGVVDADQPHVEVQDELFRRNDGSARCRVK